MNPHELPPLKLISWQRDHRNSRVGFAEIELATSLGLLTIRDIAIHRNCGSRFVAMPSGAHIIDGRARYSTVLKWANISSFRAGVIALVEHVDPHAFDEPTEVTKSQGAAA